MLNLVRFVVLYLDHLVHSTGRAIMVVFHATAPLWAYLGHFIKLIGLGVLGIFLVQGFAYLLGLLFRRYAAVFEVIGSLLAMAWYMGCFLAGFFAGWFTLPAVQVLCFAIAVAGSVNFHRQCWEEVARETAASRPGIA